MCAGGDVRPKFPMLMVSSPHQVPIFNRGSLPGVMFRSSQASPLTRMVASVCFTTLGVVRNLSFPLLADGGRPRRKSAGLSILPKIKHPQARLLMDYTSSASTNRLALATALATAAVPTFFSWRICSRTSVLRWPSARAVWSPKTASISSKERPLVSGTQKKVNNRAPKQKMAKKV